MERKNIEELITATLEIRDAAYAPYSGYQVAAALKTSSGAIYTGCNIENASYGATNCAERTAAFQAVLHGDKSFEAIAIVGGKGQQMDYAYPCGICRQVLREFSNPDTMQIIIAKSKEDYQVMTLSALLPYSFGPENLQ